MKPDENLGTISNILKAPSSLYHYSSQNGLLNIIKHKKIWATHIRYLNDASEWVYPQELIRTEIDNCINQLQNKIATPPAIGTQTKTLQTNEKRLLDTLHTFKQWFSEDIKTSEDKYISRIYVSSFSEERDDLNQWRGYCPNGNGFCIGFDRKKLFQIAKKLSCIVARCEYDEKTIIRRIKAILVEFTNNFLQKPSVINDLMKLSESFYSFAPFIKNKAFEDEKELRIFYNDISNISHVEFREGKSMIVPYIAFDLAEEGETIPINEIIIGPAPHMELSQHAIKTMLMGKGFDQFSVDKMVTLSKIPYRAW